MPLLGAMQPWKCGKIGVVDSERPFASCVALATLCGASGGSEPGTVGSMYCAPNRTNISFCVLSPPVIGQASQSPSPAPGDESQLASSSAPLHAAPTLPATQPTGLHVPPTVPWALGGMRDRRVTSSTSGEPSGLTPLLYVPQ